MSSCLITRNQKGRITNVVTPQGTPSKLFAEIHSNIFLGDTEASLDIFTNAYTDNIQEMFKDEVLNKYDTGEPELFYISPDGKEFKSLGEMLHADVLGESKIGFKNPTTNEFIEIHRFGTNGNKVPNFLSSTVQEGLLSPRRVLGKDGITRFKGEGQFTISSRASARGVKFEAMCSLGKGNIKVNRDGTLEMNFSDDFVVGLNSDGSVDLLHINALPRDGGNYENKIDIIAADLINNRNPRPITSNSKPVVPQEDKTLEQSLKNFLNNLGFDITTMEAYRKDYNTKYGKDPDINAIADLTNNVVAIAEGQDLTDKLLEEVAHVAIEAYANQNSIVGALVNIHLTEEYKQFSEQYREKYSEFHSGIELEDKVRKEILGKILAKTIQEQFSTENKTEEEKDTIDKLKDIWNKIVGFLQYNYGAFQKQTYNDLSRRVAEQILNQNISQFTNDYTKDNNFFYDLDPQNTEKGLDTDLRVAKTAIENLYKSLIKKPVPLQSELDKISTDMEEITALTSINAIRATTGKLLANVKKAIDEAEKNDTVVALDQTKIFEVIDSSVMPLLEGLEKSLKKMLKDGIISEVNITKAKDILAEIDKVTALKSDLNPEVEKDQTRQVEMMMDEALEDTSLTHEQKEEIKQKTRDGLKDVSAANKTFGIISGTENLLLQLMHQRASRINSDTAMETKVVVDNVVNYIYDKGLEKYESKLARVNNGKKTHYFNGMIDFAKFDEDVLQTQIDLIVQITKKDKEEVSKHLTGKHRADSLLSSDADKKRYTKELTEALQKLKERARIDSYYQERINEYLEANTSEDTQATILGLSGRRSDLYRPYTDKTTGVVDKTNMTEYEREEEQNIKETRTTAKSAVDQFGKIKTGLAQTEVENLTEKQLGQFSKNIQDFLRTKPKGVKVVTLDEVTNLDDLPSDSRMSLDFNTLDLLNLAKVRADSTISEAFIKKIQDLELTGSAYEFMEANATIALNSKFFDLIGEGTTYTERAQQHINTISDKKEKYEKQLLLDKYKSDDLALSNLKKLARDNRNPLEIRANNLDSVTRQSMRDLENVLDITRADLAIPASTETKKPTSIKSVNEAYYALLTESGLEELEFAKSHMTIENKARIAKYEVAVDSFLSSHSSPFRSQKFQAFTKSILQSGKISDKVKADLKNGTPNEKLAAREEAKRILKAEFARDSVASYLLKFEPIGYSEFMDGLKKGDIKISEILANKDEQITKHSVLQYLDINPDYTWMKSISDEDSANPNFDKDGPYTQPLVSKYADKKFFEYFGINMKKWLEKPTMDLTQLTPTLNKEEYDLLQTMVGLNRESISRLGDTQTSNPYQLAQMSKNNTEDILFAAKTGNFKEFFRDWMTNRSDEQNYGTQVEGDNISNSGAKMIPKYGQVKLEDVDALTDHTISASLMNFNQAVLYKNRVEAESDFKALQWGITDQTFVESTGGRSKRKVSKPGATSDYLKMGNEYMDHTLYGVKQTKNLTTTVAGRDIDFTKLINKFQAMVRFANLAYNPVVDAVSFTTGVWNSTLDRLAGDYYHPSSANKAFSQMMSMHSEYLSESGKVNKTGMLHHLLDFFDMENFEGRIGNSSFSRMLKWTAESSHKLSNWANMPVGPRTLLAVLNDYRYVDGRFMNYELFFEKQVALDKTKSKSVIDAEWMKFENDSVFENLTVDRSGIVFNDKYLSKFETKEQATAAFKKLVAKLSQRAKVISQAVDGTVNAEDQVAAQRNVITNLMMTHRSWLSILLSRRFKKGQFSLSTGRMEEGHFRTLMNVLYDLAKAPGKSSEILKNLNLSQRKNMKRFVIESTLWLGMIALGMTIMSADGDDDDEFEDLAQLIYLRTLSEVSTQQFLGISKATLDVAENPFVAIRTVKALEPVELLTDVFSFEGEKVGKRLTKNTILKRYSQFEDLNKQVNSFIHFNQSTLPLIKAGDK